MSMQMLGPFEHFSHPWLTGTRAILLELGASKHSCCERTRAMSCHAQNIPFYNSSPYPLALKNSSSSPLFFHVSWALKGMVSMLRVEPLQLSFQKYSLHFKIYNSAFPTTLCSGNYVPTFCSVSSIILDGTQCRACLYITSLFCLAYLYSFCYI